MQGRRPENGRTLNEIAIPDQLLADFPMVEGFHLVEVSELIEAGYLTDPENIYVINLNVNLRGNIPGLVRIVSRASENFTGYGLRITGEPNNFGIIGIAVTIQSRAGIQIENISMDREVIISSGNFISVINSHLSEQGILQSGESGMIRFQSCYVAGNIVSGQKCIIADERCHKDPRTNFNVPTEAIVGVLPNAPRPKAPAAVDMEEIALEQRLVGHSDDKLNNVLFTLNMLHPQVKWLAGEKDGNAVLVTDKAVTNSAAVLYHFKEKLDSPVPVYRAQDGRVMLPAESIGDNFHKLRALKQDAEFIKAISPAAVERKF